MREARSVLMELLEEKITITCPACDRKHERAFPHIFDRICDDCLKVFGMKHIAPEDVIHILENLESMKFSTLVDTLDEVDKSLWNQLIDSIKHPGRGKLIRSP